MVGEQKYVAPPQPSPVVRRARRETKRPQGPMPQRGKKRFSPETEAKIVETYAKLPAREVGAVLGIEISYQGVLDIVRRRGGEVRPNTVRLRTPAG